MAGTVDQGELQAVMLLLEVTGGLHREGREAQVQRDPSLTGLGVLVEGGRGRGAAQGPSERRLPAVDVPQHPDVEVQCFDGGRHAAGVALNSPPAPSGTPLSARQAQILRGVHCRLRALRCRPKY